jgi:hypothetical protein
MNHVLIIMTVGACLLWGAWREYASNNHRDSKLLAGLGTCTVLGSAGAFFATA